MFYETEHHTALCAQIGASAYGTMHTATAGPMWVDRYDVDTHCSICLLNRIQEADQVRTTPKRYLAIRQHALVPQKYKNMLKEKAVLQDSPHTRPLAKLCTCSRAYALKGVT